MPKTVDNSGLSVAIPDPWTLLRTEADSVPPELCRSEPGSKFQAFEILMARLASRIEPAYEFRATPIQGDGGIDFIGTRSIFRIPKYELEHVSVIVGQVKARDDSDVTVTADKEFGADPRKATDAVLEKFGSRPTLLILATSRRMTTEQRAAAKASIQRVEATSTMFLTRPELEYLISKHLVYLHPVFNHFLKDRAAEVIDYFAQKRDAIPEITIAATAPAKAETGQPFVIRIGIDVPPLTDLHVRWRYANIAGREILREITPPGIASDRGIPLVHRHGVAAIDLKLVGYAAGRHELGAIEVLQGDSVVAHQPLGYVQLLEAYHPPFFRDPYATDLTRFASWLAATEVDQVHVVTVTGLGGTGKSRLCGEFGFDVERAGGRWLSLSHPQHRNDPYALLLDLAGALVPTPRDVTESESDRVVDFLGKIQPALAKRLKRVLGGGKATGLPPDEQPRRVFTDVLTVLLLQAASQQLVGIHLSDLHWSDSLLLHVAGDVVQRLRALRADGAAVAFRLHLLFVLEGRRMQAHAAAEDGEAANTVAWETFVASRGNSPLDHHIDVRPMSEATSARFVDFVFASTETSRTPTARELIPNQKLLVATLQARAAGTPLFITEYIRLLRARGELAATSTGLVYLSKALEGPIEIPDNVDEIIVSRFRYLQSLHADAALLIRAVAFIKDRVTRALYERLRDEVAPGATDEVVASSDFVQLPATMAESVAFRHESYYERLSAVVLTNEQRRRIAAVYASWLAKQPRSASTSFDRGLVFEQDPDATESDVDAAFREAVQLADLQPLVAARAAAHLVQLYPAAAAELRALPPARFLDFLGLRLQLLRAMTNACNWPAAHREVDTILGAVEAVSGRAWPGSRKERAAVLKTRAEARVQLINISAHEMRHDLSIAVAEELLAEIARMSPKERDDWWKIEGEAEDRFGIALKVDGQYDRALEHFGRAIELARTHDDDSLECFWKIDFAAAQLRSDRDAALATLREVLAFADAHERDDASTWEAVVFMADIHLAGAELATLDPTAHETADLVAEILQRMERVHLASERNGWGYDEGAAALIAGTCTAVLGRSADALRWFMRVLDLAVRDRSTSFQWKAHVALAQLCFDADARDAGAELHAREGERLLREHIERRPASSAGTARTRYAGPLAQVHRVWCGLEADRAAALLRDYPEIGGDWRRAAPLHVAVGRGAIFFMN